jgi:hypothetical protein
MKIIEGSGKKKKLVVIVHLHGVEYFGTKLFNYFEKNIAGFPELKVIFANEEAAEKNIRFIDQDLNRSFPGNRNGNHEEKLAAAILDEINGYENLIDVHTTTSDLKMLPIIAKLTAQTKRLINLTDSREVMMVPNSDYSLIGNFNSSISIEFNEHYADENGLSDLLKIIADLSAGKKHKSISRKVFAVDGKIPMSLVLPKTAKNFEHFGDLGYLLLLFEKYYSDYQGFYAKSFESIVI